MTEMTVDDLIARLEEASGPDRELDAAIMFHLYAKPVGQSPIDGGPTGYLWPEDNPSWAFGIRFPGKDREWFRKPREDSEVLLVEADGALVKMNGLRIPKLTASINAAMTLADPRALWAVGSMEDGPFARLCWPMPNGGFAGGYQEAKAATVPIAAVIASLKARAKEGTEDGR